MLVLTCVVLAGGVSQSAAFAQTAQLVCRQGRIEISADSVRGLVVVVRDTAGLNPQTRAILGFPSFTFHDGRHVGSHLTRIDRINEKSSSRTAAVRI